MASPTVRKQRGLAVLTIAVFSAIYLAVTLFWSLPIWVAALYLVASAVCFVAYAIDKSAAVAGRRRVSEKTLILLGFACGWPGAIAAQQTLRHKTQKVSFRSAFRGSVALNIAVFVALSSPLVPALLARAG